MQAECTCGGPLLCRTVAFWSPVWERSWWAQGGVRVLVGVGLRQLFFAKGTEVFQ